MHREETARLTVPPSTAKPWNAGREKRSGPSSTATAVRVLRAGLIALVPPLVAFAGDVIIFSPLGSRWLLLVAAVIVSAANGGMASGLVATITSTALAWWYLIPPVRTLTATDPRHYLSVALFLAVGFAISLLHERLRLTNAGLARAARRNHIFAAFAENSLDFLGIADPRGTPLYVNPAGRRMVELPDDVDIARTNVPEYYPPDQRSLVEDSIMTSMARHGKWAGETSLRNWRTGASIPVLDTHFIIRDPNTDKIIGTGMITRDISAQKAQRDELQQANERLAATTRELGESQRFLQGILDYSPNGIIIKTVDGRYSVVNNAFRTIMRVGLESARGRTDPDLFPADLAKRLRANDEQALATRQALTTEESVDFDGDHRAFVVTKFPLFDRENAIFALGGIWTDITRRKRDEDSLREAAAELRAAQRVARVGSWRWNIHTGEIQWSEELYRILGLDPSQPRRTPMHLDQQSQTLTEDTRAQIRAAVDRTLADGSAYEIDFPFSRPDGSGGWLAARGEAIRDEAGRIIGITGTCADITRLKELERLRDEWTSVIAHDLRQPIGTILMASEILPTLRENGLNHEERTLAERILSASRSLRRMVDDLLDMSLLESNRLRLERKITEPARLVDETLTGLAHLPGIERVHVRVESNLPAVCVDPMRVQQVLGNLVSNAIKYGEPQSEITITMARRADGIEIAVTNRGQGIAADELPRLFNRFTRARSTRGSGVRGLGLGLYIANGIVQAHGGTLRAESTPGESTTFTVALPVGSEQRQAA
jgi:PAS domain S-box-containing protein